jgi:DNA polymerase III delta subunit
VTTAAGAPALDPLRRRLASKDRPRVVAAVGPEAWLREEVLRTVAAAVLGSADSPDLVTVRADDPAREGPEDVLREFFAEARTGNLFGGEKVVALRGADTAAASDEKAFVAWLASPSSAATVVLLADELPAALTNAVRDAGVLVLCGGRGSAQEAPDRFVARCAAARGKRIGSEEASMLVDLVGDDLGALEQAVEVLSLHAGDEPAIGAAAVRALFPGARQGDAEDFANAVLENRPADALAAASRCFDDGVPEAWGSSRVARDERSVAFVLVREFAKSLQRVLDARRQLDAGIPRGQVDLGRMPPFLRDRCVRLAAQRRPESLDSMTLLLEETDRGMKSGGATGRVAVARLATAAGRLK